MFDEPVVRPRKPSHATISDSLWHFHFGDHFTIFVTELSLKPKLKVVNRQGQLDGLLGPEPGNKRRGALVLVSLYALVMVGDDNIHDDDRGAK
ncbi:hypothetical protein B0T09DRAFT_379530 [Sordaria sp. MPI-SDFR-AT-0083]|nr:hypothetical protein B0T09DRAFT_379530 [Sordaria sp. MPI-SDFR-AT-0083]